MRWLLALALICGVASAQNYPNPGPGMQGFFGGGSPPTLEIGVGAAAADTDGNVTTASRTTQASGSACFVMVNHASGNTANAPTDNMGNTYIALGTNPQSTSSYRLDVFYDATCAGGAGHTVSCTLTAAAEVSCIWREVKGVTAVDTAAVNATTDDSSSPFTVTSGTLAQANSIVLLFFGSNSGDNPATITEATFTQDADSRILNGALYWTGGLLWKTVASTTGVAASVTQTGGSNGSLKIGAVN